MEYRVDVGIKNMEKMEKIYIMDIFGSCVPVHPSRTQSVPVHFRGVPVHLLLCSQFRPIFVFFP